MARELPQGTVTILFTDVVGSTRMATRSGDDRAHVAMQAQRDILRRQIQRHNGYEVKTMGDGFMVAFRSARDAIACATGAQRALERHRREHPADAVHVRMGLNTGEVIVEGNDLFGATVIAAERVMSRAKRDQIFVSEAVRAVLGAASDISMTDLGRVQLKGFPARLRIFEVAWAAEEPAWSPLGPERLPFVRRESERARLVSLLDRAQQGQGSLVIIAGDAGVGKTRLAEEVVAGATERGFVTLTGRCYEGSGAPPYGCFIEVLDCARAVFDGDALDALGEITAIMERRSASTHQSAAGRVLLFAAWARLVTRAAAIRPLLLLVDDLQWADVTSVELLRSVARSLPRARAAIIATYRDSEISASSPLAGALDEFRSKRLAVEMSLRPLTEEGVDDLLRAASGRQPPRTFARQLFRQTRGNPLFVQELYRHLAEDGRLFDESGDWRSDVSIEAAELPGSLRRVIGRRIARLGAETRRVLNAAAVAGPVFELAIVGSMLEMAHEHLLDGIDDAEHARIIEAEDGIAGRYRFAHPLLRSAVLAELAASQQQRLHARAAASIEQFDSRSAADESALAHHYVAAGPLADPVRALVALRRAGATALALYANSEALARLEAALRVAERARGIPQHAIAEAWLLTGQAQFRLGDWKESGASLDRALSMFEAEQSALGRGRTLYAKASLATFEARPSDAVDLLERALELLPDDDPQRGHALQLRGQNLVDLRQYDRAAVDVGEAFELAERLDNASVRNHAHIASGYLALATLDMRRAASDFAFIARSDDVIPHERMAAESRRAIALALLGNLDEASEHSTRARAYFSSMQDSVSDGDVSERDPYEYGIACLSEGIVEIAQARFSAASDLLMRAIDTSGTPPNIRVAWTLAPLALQLAHLAGDQSRAAGLLDMVSSRRERVRSPFVALYEALDAATNGRADASGAPPWMPRSGAPDINSLAIRVLAAEATLALGRDVPVEPHLEAIEFLNERGVLWTLGWVALVPRLLGALYAATGAVMRARVSLESALTIAEGARAPLEEALTCMELAALDARSSPGLAQTRLARARDIVSGLGVRSCDRRMAQIQGMFA